MTGAPATGSINVYKELIFLEACALNLSVKNDLLKERATLHLRRAWVGRYLHMCDGINRLPVLFAS